MLFKQRHTWLQILYSVYYRLIWHHLLNSCYKPRCFFMWWCCKRDHRPHNGWWICPTSRQDTSGRLDYRKNAFIRSGILSWSHLSRFQNGRNRYGGQPVQLGIHTTMRISKTEQKKLLPNLHEAHRKSGSIWALMKEPVFKEPSCPCEITVRCLSVL